ncbi:MAG: hypothetical protein H0V82_00115 [Candidatus Protochlamydia sp.]|nr:hypothetical protein [Candidatus Protochlamydia sp.]
MGLQFENIVLNNRREVWRLLDLQVENIVFENPYFQSKTTKQEGCQIDYLIQTRYNTLYICEMKFSDHAIGKDIIGEMEKKIATLKIPKGFACLPILIHGGKVVKSVIESRYFAKIINIMDCFN